MKPDSYSSHYHELVQLIESAFEDLGIPITAAGLESLVKVIHESMSARYRTYHTVQHILDVCQGASSLEILGAAFHDVVYLQVDKRIHPVLLPYVSDFQISKDFRVLLPKMSSLAPGDPAHEVYSIFGFHAKTELTPFSGANEFLSAVAAARILSPYLNLWQTIQLIAIIEGTIPFRDTTSDGRSSSELLADRIRSVILSKKLSIHENEVDLCIQATVLTANRDVAGFAFENVGNFVNGTWDLILEGNPAFRNPLYLISQYRTALQRIESFISKLRPDLIFRRYKETPSDKAFQKLMDQASHNLLVQKEYLESKLIESAVLEVIALLTGGDCPMAQFFGEVPVQGQEHVSILDQLLDHSIPQVSQNQQNAEVISLLSKGRTKTSEFDFNHSPIAAYIYQRISKIEFENILQAAKNVFSEKLEPIEFLRTIPIQILLPILEAISKVSWLRKNKFQELKQLIMR